MSHICFCHNHTKEKLCGLCCPCEQKMEMYMEFLLLVSAQKRYLMSKLIGKILGEKGKKMHQCLYRKLLEMVNFR